MYFSQFVVIDPTTRQEMHFKDKVTDSLELLVEGSSYYTWVTEIGVFYDFSKGKLCVVQMSLCANH